MSELPPGGESSTLVALRVFPKLAAAREAALALAALEIPHQIDRRGNLWVLSVEPPFAEAAAHELAEVAAEQAEPPPPPDPRAVVPLSFWSLLLAGTLLLIAFLAQSYLGDRFTEAGHASSRLIIERGEWHRCFTALFLHGDLGHLLANLGFGFVFAASVLPQFGTGFGWLLIVLTGAAGNAINAWGYRGQGHASIGASTAVFGALGLLVAGELYYRWTFPATRTRRHLLAPLGAGLALLAWLGVGESQEKIDFMAHLWGFVAGLLLGLIAAMATRAGAPPRRLQLPAGLAALLLPAAAWLRALWAQ